MNTLLVIFIIWTIISVLSNNKKKQPPIATQEQETSTYRLPSDLRGKWGPKSEEVKGAKTYDENIEEPRAGEPMAVTKKVDVSEIQQRKEKPPAGKLDTRTQVFPDKMEEHECCGCGSFKKGEFSPGMLRNGIILSEILGPPVARRKRRTYQ